MLLHFQNHSNMISKQKFYIAPFPQNIAQTVLHWCCVWAIFGHAGEESSLLIRVSEWHFRHARVVILVFPFLYKINSSRFPSLGIPRLELVNPRWNSYVGHWNSYVRIPMSNIGIPTWVFSFLPRFLPNLMIFIISINLSSFIGTIYIEKSSNLSKIWAEMRKTTLEFRG